MNAKQKILYILDLIETASGLTATGQPCTFDPDVVDDDKVTYVELKAIMDKLAAENVIKIFERPNTRNVITPGANNIFYYKLTVVQPTFDEYAQSLRAEPKPQAKPQTNKNSITEDNVQKRYDLLEYIDGMADDDGNAIVQTATFKDVDPVLINVWLGHLQVQEGLIDILQRTEIDNYVVYRLKIKDRQKFRDYVDELYRWLKLSVPSLSTNNFLAVFDLAYELHQKLEVSRGNTVDVADTPNTKRFPQLNDESINYRTNALQFLEDYGAISKLEHDGLVFYHVTVVRRFFDRTYQTIMTRALQDGYVTYKKDAAATQALAKESKRRQQTSNASEDRPPVTTVANKISAEPINNDRVTFDAKTSVLTYGNKTCNIPDESLEYYVCKFAFKNRRAAAKELDILDAAGTGQDSQRPVYDAHLRVNKKAREQLGIDKLLNYKAAKIRIAKNYI